MHALRVLLALALAAQVFVWVGRRALPHPLPEGPLPGQRLPSLEIGFVSGSEDRLLGDAVAEAERCTLVTFVSTQCHVCARMRVTWRHALPEWEDSIGGAVQSVWIAEEDSAEMASFLEGFDLGTTEVAYASNDRARARMISAFGVIGTPTLYLLEPGGTVIQGVMGDQLPHIPVARAQCSR